MDQSVRPNLTDPDSAAAHVRAKTVRRLARGAVVIVALGVVLVIWSVISSYSASAKLKEATEAQSVITVSTVNPQPLTGHSDLVLPGNLQANYEAPIYARTSGYLKRWLVDIGAPVKAGQLLGEIESPEIDS